MSIFVISLSIVTCHTNQSWPITHPDHHHLLFTCMSIFSFLAGQMTMLTICFCCCHGRFGRSCCCAFGRIISHIDTILLFLLFWYDLLLAKKHSTRTCLDKCWHKRFGWHHWLLIKCCINLTKDKFS